MSAQSAEDFYTEMIKDARQRIATLTGDLWKASDAVPERTAEVVSVLRADIEKFESVLEAIRAHRT